MKITKGTVVVIGLVSFVPAAHAQEQLWIRQFGTSAVDLPMAQ